MGSYEMSVFEARRCISENHRDPSRSLIIDLLSCWCLVQNAHKVPPPWLIAMQRYGPPPSYPNLKIPGLNSPIPDVRPLERPALRAQLSTSGVVVHMCTVCVSVRTAPSATTQEAGGSRRSTRWENLCTVTCLGPTPSTSR